MDLILLTLGILALIVGLIGAIMPLPGPPLSFLGLLCLRWSHYVDVSVGALVVIGVVTGIVAVLDYFVPIWGVKRFGGTSYGSWGAMIGMTAGFFLPIPGGIFVGAFAGAMLAELLGGMASGKAFKAAIGSLLGFVAGIFMKVTLCLCMIGYAIWARFA
jgi:uncharacterized protein YqgC (DUF456 family)